MDKFVCFHGIKYCFSGEGFYLVLHAKHVTQKTRGIIQSNYYDLTGKCLSFLFNARSSLYDDANIFTLESYYVLNVFSIDENGRKINLNASTNKQDVSISFFVLLFYKYLII